MCHDIVYGDIRGFDKDIIVWQQQQDFKFVPHELRPLKGCEHRTSFLKI